MHEALHAAEQLLLPEDAVLQGKLDDGAQFAVVRVPLELHQLRAPLDGKQHLCHGREVGMIRRERERLWGEAFKVFTVLTEFDDHDQALVARGIDVVRRAPGCNDSGVVVTLILDTYAFQQTGEGAHCGCHGGPPNRLV